MVKFAYRVIRADSIVDDTVLVLETQESNGNDEQNVDSFSLEENLTTQIDSPTPQEHQQRDDNNISIITENKLYFALTLK